MATYGLSSLPLGCKRFHKSYQGNRDLCEPTAQRLAAKGVVIKTSRAFDPTKQGKSWPHAKRILWIS